MNYTGRSARRYINNLSQRELQVLELVSLEQTTQEISQRLYISHNTVISHRKNVRRKLNVRNAAGMVRKAFELGLLK